MLKALLSAFTGQTAKFQSGKAGVAGIGAMGVAAAAAAVGGAQLMTDGHGAGETPLKLVEDRSEVCLIGDMALVKGARGGCYARATLSALQEAAVLGPSGEEVVLTLAHPTDDLAPVAVVRTCAAFRDYREKGWYAFSSREMRREAAFVKSCGALGMLVDSKTPNASLFEGGRLSAADVSAIVGQRPVGITDGVAAPATQAAPTEKIAAADALAVRGAPANGAWRVTNGGQKAALQEIAHADFTGDGFGDILLFVAVGVDKATAAAAFLTIVEKTPAATGPLMSLIDPSTAL
ncbi:MAG: hypothetical protein AAF224_05670 [Pseudomonadota bacterium]